jgi:asparagine synthase (glutamine-hydrolysing)
MVCDATMSAIDIALRTDDAALQIPATADRLTLDGDTWIAAVARIDARDDLVATLGAASTRTTSDAELILRAFMKWDERCVDHLLGDFVFAIWDGRGRRLFCARDHFGIKPLYYVDATPWLLVSTSVDRLRTHPIVSDALDDCAVADFLLFGHKTDPAATIFRDVRRVPPAHTLSWSPVGGCRVHQYWELPVDGPVYRKDAEYIEVLRELLGRAVADRLRGGRAGVFLSGGLDSAAVALTARRRTSAPDGIRAFCFVHESLPGDDERRHAAATAAHLDMRCDFYETGSPGWRSFTDARTPEPLMTSIDPAVQARCLQDAAVHSGVAFTGEGADNALFYEWTSYTRYLRRAGRLGRLARDAATFVRHHRRLPLSSILMRGRSPVARIDSPPAIPPWISRDLAIRVHLEDRWRSVMRPAVSPHPTRPVAYFSLQLPLWQDLFDSWDPSYTGVALDVRHPFLDLSLLRFLLSVPVIPWCRDKHLLRYAFRDDLPEAVRRRKKTPLAGSLHHTAITRNGPPPVMRSPRLEAYASAARLTRTALQDPALAESVVRLSTFSWWLGRLDSSGVQVAQR